AHVRVVDIFQNFRDDIFKRHGDKLHARCGAITRPQEMRDFLDAEFVFATAEIEKTKMCAHAAAHREITGDSGVEAAGHQCQHRVLTAKRITADAGKAAVDDE